MNDSKLGERGTSNGSRDNLVASHKGIIIFFSSLSCMKWFVILKPDIITQKPIIFVKPN